MDYYFPEFGHEKSLTQIAERLNLKREMGESMERLASRTLYKTEGGKISAHSR
jgi:hypothetical protein